MNTPVVPQAAEKPVVLGVSNNCLIILGVALVSRNKVLEAAPMIEAELSSVIANPVVIDTGGGFIIGSSAIGNYDRFVIGDKCKKLISDMITAGIIDDSRSSYQVIVGENLIGFVGPL
jgi:hypothetical protein